MTTATVSKAKKAKSIKITGKYNDDLKAAIAAGLLPAGARPKKAAVEEAIKLHNNAEVSSTVSVPQSVATLSKKPATAKPVAKIEYATCYVCGPTQADMKGVISTPVPFSCSNGGDFRKVEIPAAIEREQLKIYQDCGAYNMAENVFQGEISEPGSLIVIPHAKPAPVATVRFYVAGGKEFDTEKALSAETLHHWQDKGDLRLVEIPGTIAADQLKVYSENNIPVMTEAEFSGKLKKFSTEIVSRKSKKTTATLGGKASKASQGKTSEPVHFPASEVAKMPRQGSHRRTLVDLLASGCTLDQIAAIVPNTNKATPKAFMTKAVRCGFGIEERDGKFYLIQPKKVIDQSKESKPEKGVAKIG